MKDLFNEEPYLLGALRTIVATASSTGARVAELSEIAKSAISHVENCKRETPDHTTMEQR